ncbi:hypothetical protein IF2G_05480 [Cordyceps javanica]|nr:hypothetical protein IF2G_05480 [Cordyceps javanica]
MGLGTDTRSGPSGRQEGRAAGGRCTQLTVFISGILLSLVTKLPSTKVPTNTAFRSPQRCFSQSLYFVGSEQLHQLVLLEKSLALVTKGPLYRRHHHHHHRHHHRPSPTIFPRHDGFILS